jgi:PAS fold
MSTGGMRVMEIDDFAPFAMCPWVEFWDGEQQGAAREAVSAAKTGEVRRFVGPTPTAKGNMRWWEVVVSPIRGRDGSVEKLLSISRDITHRHSTDEHQRMLFEEMRHRIKNTHDPGDRRAELTRRRHHGRGAARDPCAFGSDGQGARSLDRK